MSKERLFNHAACFSDIHFGLRNNSRTHNNDCEEFVEWFINESRKRNCETCIFLGDWHHHRSSINVSTLNYTMSNLKKLNDAFNDVYIIIGNHDLFYREKREIHSLIMGQELENIHLIDEPLIEGDVAIMPWIVGDEWKDIPKIKTKYMFGHFEIPGFKMNQLVEMPDHGTIRDSHFKHQEYVFSGHFHKRQQSKNIHYIGNPFGHNFADAGDFERGAMFLEWDGTPEYVDWEDGPRYVKLKLSELLSDPDAHLKKKTYLRAVVDVNINYEEVNFIRDTLSSNYDIRQLRLIEQNNTEHSDIEFEGDVGFETVDQIVYDQLKNIESETYKTEKLIELYNRI